MESEVVIWEEVAMKMSITRYGMPQVAIIPGAVLVAGAICYFVLPGAVPWAQIAAVVLTIGILAFFRDPQRVIPTENNVLLCPADGKVTDICQVDEQEFIGGPAMRIGVFLSVFDVHINRSPIAGTVGYIKEIPGKCLNAMRSKDASEQNQATCMGLNCDAGPVDKVMVKQITGAIARRIVCECTVGETLAIGEKYGMIKFGSRTELFLPVDDKAQIMVEPGQTVRAGTTILVRYKV